MDLYELQVLVGAVSYITMYPTLVAIPRFWSYAFFNVGIDSFNDENTKSMEAVFLLLLVVVGPSYVATLIFKYRNFIAISVIQRITIVFMCAVLTFILDQDAFSKGQFVGIMFVVDVCGGAAHGMVNPDGGIRGCFKTCKELFYNAPTTPFNKALKVEAYFGMVYGIVSIVYIAVTSDIKLGVIITMVATFIVFLWIGFHGSDASQTPLLLLIAHRLLIAGILFYLAEDKDFDYMNDIFRLMIVAMVGAIFTPYLSALVTGGASLYFLMKLMLQGGGSIAAGIATGVVILGVSKLVLQYGSSNVDGQSEFSIVDEKHDESPNVDKDPESSIADEKPESTIVGEAHESSVVDEKPESTIADEEHGSLIVDEEGSRSPAIEGDII